MQRFLSQNLFPFCRQIFKICLLLTFVVSLVYAEDNKKNDNKPVPLFDGTLNGWSVPKYGGEGKVKAEKDVLVLEAGTTMTGVLYEKPFPKTDYELTYEARRTKGSDFFAACTFPVKKEFCTLVNGGWGGSLVGISSVNGMDASENETSSSCDFVDNEWYRFRIQVSDKKIQVWIAERDKKDAKNAWKEKQVIDFETADRSLSVRFEMSQYTPLGFCSWASEGEIRNIRYTKIDVSDNKDKQ